MKIVLLGRGHRIGDILDAVHARRSETLVVSLDEDTLRSMKARGIHTLEADPADFRVADRKLVLGPDDLVIVADYLEPTLRAALSNLQAQRLAGTLLVFTPLSARELSRDFPHAVVRSDRSIYKTEMREVVRRTSSGHKVAALRAIAKESARLVIVIWGNPDPDALGSALALRELLLRDCKDLQIVYTGEFTRPENSAMVQLLKIPATKYRPDLVAPGTTVATVDAQPSFFAPGLVPRFDLVIDHHPETDLPAHRFADVRPRYGSTSTILTEYYRDTGVRMNRRIATALYYGLKVDTANLTRNVSDPDILAFRHLRPHVDEIVLRTIELQQLPQSTLDFFGIAIANKRIRQDAAFSYVGRVENPDVCVHVADFLIKLQGIGWAIVACRAPGRVVVVFRSDGFRKHAGKVAEECFLPWGTAGGHRTMARAELPLEKLAAVLPDPTDVAVEAWLLERLGGRIKALASREKKSGAPVAGGPASNPAS